MKTRHLTSSLSVVIIICTATGATADGYKAVQNFECTYVTTAFEDESSFRKTLSPPPHPNALATLHTREIAHFVGGFLTAWNALSSNYDVRDEAYDVYPSGLFAALDRLQNYCTTNPTKSLIDGLYQLLASEEANPIQRAR